MFFKLFDRKGKFLCDVGAFGGGPGEYRRRNDIQLDEENGRILILPFQTRQLVMYNLQGEYIKSIPLAGYIPMGNSFFSLSLWQNESKCLYFSGMSY